MMEAKKRIEFIDLAKGICIILVVVGHCGAPINIPGYEIVRMPLYFILSGLFFKDYGGFNNFLLQKTNKILIPFLFFYLLGYAVFYSIKAVAPDLLITEARGLWDVFDNRQFFNGPIWFLLCLFWCNVFFYIIYSLVNNDIVRIAITLIIGSIGWYMGNMLHIFVPLFLDVALTALPFFVVGYYLKKTEILYPNKYDKYNILFAIFLWGISFLLIETTHYRLSLHYNGLEGWSTYIISIVSVLSILFFCKIIKYIPLVSYMGRYSIVLLCTHHMVYRPLKVLLIKISVGGDYRDIIIAIFTLLISTALIPVCKKYIPWFVAQKDLIKVSR